MSFCTAHVHHRRSRHVSCKAATSYDAGSGHVVCKSTTAYVKLVTDICTIGLFMSAEMHARQRLVSRASDCALVEVPVLHTCRWALTEGVKVKVTILQGAAWSLPGRVCSKNSNEVVFAKQSGSDTGHPSICQQAESSGSKLRTHGKTHSSCDTMSPSQVNSGC